MNIKKQKKILFLTHNLCGGGAEKVIISLTSYLQKKGWEADILLLKKKIDYDLSGILDASSIKHVLNENEKTSTSIVKYIYKLFKYAHSYDIIVGAMELLPSYIAIIFGKILRKKIVCINHIHLSSYIKYCRHKKAHYYLTKLLAAKSDHIICVSNEAKLDLINKFNVPANRINVIYNPIELLDIKQKSMAILPNGLKDLFDKPVIIYVGSLIKRKGVDILIKAFHNILYEKKIDSNLILIGKGNCLDELKNIAESMGISEKVHFIGFDQNPYKYMSKGSVFVLPSYAEGLPMVIIEAMACGCPVVSTKCSSGPSELLKDGGCGSLVPVGDHKKLSDAIVDLLADTEKQNMFRNRGMNRSKEFNIDNILPEYEKLFASL